MKKDAPKFGAKPKRLSFPKDSQLTEEGRMLRHALLETVENQILEMPEAKEAFDRMVALGYTESDSKFLMANVLSFEAYRIFKTKTKSDLEEYKRMLARLPELPE